MGSDCDYAFDKNDCYSGMKLRVDWGTSPKSKDRNLKKRIGNLKDLLVMSQPKS